VYGGIHPPADDFAGRRIGHLIGPAAWDLATKYFDGQAVPEPAGVVLWSLAMFIAICGGPKKRFA
jgi:hypothetical protein